MLNTASDALPRSSKLFRASSNPAVPPKSCIPNTLNMNTKRSKTAENQNIVPRPLATFSMSTFILLYVRRMRIERNTRTRRNARRTVRPPFCNAISRMPTITITKSNTLNLSPK